MLQLSNCGLEQVRLRVTTFSGFLGGHSTGRLSQFLGFSQRGFFSNAGAVAGYTSYPLSSEKQVDKFFLLELFAARGLQDQRQVTHSAIDLICDICSRVQDSPPGVTVTEVKQLIKTLKNNKAADGCGLVAEHLKFGGKPFAAYIAGVLTQYFAWERSPEMFRLGFITPIYKNHRKPIHDPNSY